MNKTERVFEYISTDEDGDSIYEAKFQLPDDGCPGSEQFLRVRVVVNGDKNPEIILDLLASNGEKRKPLGYTSAGIQVVSELLYKTARLVTRQSIEPA